MFGSFGTWPVVLALGGISMAAFSVTSLVLSARSWWNFALAVSGLVALVNVVCFLFLSGTPGYAVLVRDIIGVAVVAVSITVIMAALVRGLVRAGANLLVRVLAACFVGFWLMMAAPYLLLLIHCTSGDCL